MSTLSPHTFPYVHGVMLQVHGVGILLQGKSGIGKSEIAWNLLQRHHHFIADDMVILHDTPQAIVARCANASLTGQISLRQWGIINVVDYCGETAVLPSQHLQLIIQLEEVHTIPKSCLVSTDRYVFIRMGRHTIPSLTFALPSLLDPAFGIEIAAQQFQNEYHNLPSKKLLQKTLKRDLCHH